MARLYAIVGHGLPGEDIEFIVPIRQCGTNRISAIKSSIEYQAIGLYAMLLHQPRRSAGVM